MTDTSRQGSVRDASVVVARGADGMVAVLTAGFPRHGGAYVFLPGGRREDGETPEACARRELREEAGVAADAWRPLGSYAITLNSPARIHLFLAEGLTCGPQQLTAGEADFELMWWPMADAIRAATQGRFLLQGGPLALLLAQQVTAGRPERPGSRPIGGPMPLGPRRRSMRYVRCVHGSPPGTPVGGSGCVLPG
ncbi:NUDIX hydrolase [Streptomyces sp. NPDC088554]|uniref:NUDIX hydrolase n=1 Tax=Streptomyces sp. NPDC088554 TaxID=3365865 RepID=UPI0037FDE783